MTSEEIRKIPFLAETTAGIQSLDLAIWLREIAYQLALSNETSVAFLKKASAQAESGYLVSELEKALHERNVARADAEAAQATITQVIERRESFRVEAESAREERDAAHANSQKWVLAGRDWDRQRQSYESKLTGFRELAEAAIRDRDAAFRERDAARAEAEAARARTQEPPQ